MKFGLQVSIIILGFAVTTGLSQAVNISADVYFFGTRQAAVLELPLPEYPPAALRGGYGGRVTVDVVIDEKGTVTYIGDVRGPRWGCKDQSELELASIRLAAENAAARATFKVTAEGEHFIPVSAQISYVFFPGTRNAASNDNAQKSPKTRDVERSSEAAVLAAGEQTPPTPGSESRGGVVNGKAISLPKPKYPADARAAHVSGTVAVEVLIDESGEVVSSKATSGNPLLVDAAETAACSARFSPTLLSGQPVKVSGVITYNFVP